MKENTTTIDILRHGESQGGEIFRGHTDVALTSLGWQQMEGAISSLNSPWSAIVSSSLTRCAKFSHSLHQQLPSANNVLKVNLDAAFKEIHFGDWDGKPISDISQSNPDLIRLWQDPDNFCAPNGEHFKAFKLRVENAWNQLLIDYQGRHILLVTHGGVIRFLLSLVLGLPSQGMNKFHIPYGSLSRINVYHGEEGVFSSLEFHGAPHYVSV
jgi:broad specificity phosphatase PhoE